MLLEFLQLDLGKELVESTTLVLVSKVVQGVRGEKNNNIEEQFTELDLQDLEEQVAAIRANTVSARSRRIHINSSVKFVTWLLANKKQLLNDEFVYLAGKLQTRRFLSNLW